jgi:hypothetical protein
MKKNAKLRKRKAPAIMKSRRTAVKRNKGA